MDMDFERIVRTYGDSLYRIAVHYTANTRDAQDIVQQTFLKLVENRKNFESEEHEKAWLIRVCINLCKDNLKSSWHSKVSYIQERDFSAPIYEIDEKMPLLSYVKKLPRNQKAAIYLFYYEDMSVFQIAEVMNARQNTVLSWLNRGRKALKKILNEEGL